MLTLPLDSEEATLANTGGKGMNLARLTRAGLPVPGGFLITTQAYSDFVAGNQLGAFIEQTIEQTNPNDPPALNEASSAIRARFSQGQVPAETKQAIAAAYQDLSGNPPVAVRSSATAEDSPVAVRSSATAEDLPGMSFAGQQDTFLNVIGQAALLKAVVDCWSSLWTARAIGYRARNGLAHEDVALAVVVQAMVPSEASGVLFTANPLNGKRTEMVIDATLGLGEALVSGQVEPDQYIIAEDGTIRQKSIGAKATVIRGQADGGTITEQVGAVNQQAIPDTVIVELADLGHRVADLFGFPQDIEWGWADGKLHLLQSRPITSLFPIPVDTQPVDTQHPERLKVWFSFAAVQGMLDPMTPLGQDTMKGAFAGLAAVLGYEYSLNSQRILFTAGERLWVSITAVIRHPVGRKIIHGFLSQIDPGVTQAMESIWDDPRLQPEKGWFKFRTFTRVFRFLGPAFLGMLRTMRHPQQQREQFEQYLADVLSDFTTRFNQADSFAKQLDLFEEMMLNAFPQLLPRFLRVFATGMASLNLLLRLRPEDGPDPLTLTRGLPHNVTTEMDLALWQTAKAIQGDETAVTHFTTAAPDILTQEYLDQQLPTAAQTAVTHFLAQYGMRGLAEIDFGRPRWRDNPTPIMQVLQSYLNITEPTMAPDAVFERGRQEAEAAIEPLATAVRHTRGGWLKSRLVRIAARRVRAVAGLRETPKFFMVRVFGVARTGLLASAQKLVEDGLLDQPDDLFFLHLDELKALAAGEQQNWPAVITQRRENYHREKQRRQIPRLILSDGHTFYEGVNTASSDGDLAGTPVSPGSVEGVVHVILDPHGAQLAPGEILVCPGTDPAWTPLFLTAGGLITEVGGLMTHGSVVAREYGIPAVVGVDRATTRLHTGQRIRLDGSSGQIAIIDHD
ncbi:MAG: PEP/pyruvate-binding domain-containing protein [Anaerolineae bacterium]